MKRAFVGSHQSRAVDEQARTKIKYQILLDEFLELQKEFVSKKRKLQTAKQMRENLLAEVQFLRRRHGNLLKIRSLELKVGKSSVQHQNSTDLQRKVLDKGSDSLKFNEAAFENPCAVLVSHSDSRDDEEEQGRVPVVRQPLRVEKHKNYLIHAKKLGKKKITWEDQVPVNIQIS